MHSKRRKFERITAVAGVVAVWAVFYIRLSRENGGSAVGESIISAALADVDSHGPR